MAALAQTAVHIFGASGSGTSTLGAAVASAIDGVHLDTDAYYWQPTDPPFVRAHPPLKRLQAIARDTAAQPRWVLSGSLCGWGDRLIQNFTLAVFVTLDRDIRMARLKARESQRYGARIEPGGDMHATHLAFMRWAASYDTASAPTRSLALHRAWLAQLTCPVLHLDAAQPVERLTAAVVEAIGQQHQSPAR